MPVLGILGKECGINPQKRVDFNIETVSDNHNHYL
ncbi:hypothetical protein IMSAGC014_01524 [Bacteroidaceae bacterium]|nr:hypothetical protein IMSAGC014_01524 [Bacteroidaceae bacterium]